MNKNELIKKVAEIADLTARDTEKAIDTAIEVITNTIKSGGEVMLTGFGAFSSKTRHARNGVNPLNPSQKIHIPEVLVAKFKAGKALKDALKNKVKPDLSAEAPKGAKEEELEQETVAEETVQEPAEVNTSEPEIQESTKE